eukprot:5323806-Pyramimonas_sp.AAC.1
MYRGAVAFPSLCVFVGVVFVHWVSAMNFDHEGLRCLAVAVPGSVVPFLPVAVLSSHWYTFS